MLGTVRDRSTASTGMTQRALMGIVFALDAEAKTAARWQGASQALCRITGPGETPAADGARALLAAGAGALVSWGTSGALSSSLQAGQILLLKTTCRLGEPRLTADPQWLNACAEALAPLNPQLVDACTVRAPLTGAGVKRRLGERSHCEAVDMESAAVAAVAAAAGVPFLGIRAVVDPVGLEIPAAAIAGMGADGRSSPRKVMAALCRRPADLPPLLRLGLHFRQALQSLSRAATLLAGAGLFQPPTGRVQ